VIAVAAMDPTTSGATTFASKRSLPLDEVAATIAGAVVEGQAPTARPVARPRFVALDPARGLSATAARRDRLIRTIVNDPGVSAGKDWQTRAARLARRADPLASDRLVDEAIAWLLPWIDGRIGRTMAGMDRLERSIAWTLAWPPDTTDGTVFEGRIDLLGRAPGGDATLLIFSDPTAHEPRERLRALLSARAANALGLGPVRQAWRVVLGPGGGLRGEDRFDSGAIAEALRAAGL
jgi:hypothetical protein